MDFIMAEHKGYIKNADEKGSINICEDVVAVIAATAAVEVEGVHGLYHSHGKELTTTTVAGRKGISRGVKLIIDGNNVTVDLFIITDLGFSVSEIGTEIQKAVTSAIESAVGANVSAVNVNICGVSLKKAKQST